MRAAGGEAHASVFSRQSDFPGDSNENPRLRNIDFKWRFSNVEVRAKHLGVLLK